VAGPERIELPPLVSKTRMISISPRTGSYGAANEVRTRDVLLGKQVLYQLSYSRIIL